MPSAQSNERLLECDVLVVGGGPAGCTAARIAAERGARVVLVDRRQSIGVPPQCAGFVSSQIKRHLVISPEAVRQTVSTMLTFMPDGEQIESRSSGFILRRDIFDQGLADRAEKAGAKVISGWGAVDHQRGTTRFRSPGGLITVRSSVTIGADGPRSRIGRSLGIVNRDLLHACQWTVPLRKRLKSTMIFFHAELPGGYGWLFPAGRVANVGIGITPWSGIVTHQALKWFIEKLETRGLVEVRPLETSGGTIPVGGPLPLGNGDALLAGDAAGLCHSQTGAGIAAAIQSGELAGRSAAGGANDGGAGLVKSYAAEVDDLLGDSLRHAAARRRWLEPYWRRPRQELCKALRYAWVAFPEYRQHQ